MEEHALMKNFQFRTRLKDDTRIIDLTCGDLRLLIEDIFESKKNELSQAQISLLPNEMELYTRKEAAKLLKITLPTLSEWTKKGKITKSNVNGSRRVYYKPENIQKALRDQSPDVRK